MQRPPLLSVVLLCLGGALAATAVAAPAAAAPAGTTGLTYVALGDSYAAGFGVTPSIGSPPAPAVGCLQAEQNYPHQVAAQLGLNLTDVTCTGAVTANIIATPQVTADDFGGGTALPQSLALSADTDVVTVSIGGNDAGFSLVAGECVAASATGPVLESGLANCQAYYDANPAEDPRLTIPTTVATNLANAYAAIRAAAPNAKVFVVGYPSLFPDAANTPAGGCFTPLATSSGNTTNAVPFTDVDVPFIRGAEVLLNQTVATAAANAGFTFIDNEPGSVANSVCPQVTAATPAAVPFINGVTINPNGPPLTVNGTLHPNAAGISFLVAQVLPVITAAFPDPPAPVQPILAVTGADAGPTVALAAGSVILIALGAFTLVRARRRHGAAGERR